MTELYEKLKPLAQPDHNRPKHNTVFGRKAITAHATHLINLAGGILAVLEEDIHVSFVVFTPSGDWDDDAWFERVFHGSGPSSNLRELRHTFWGEADNAGYIFYPDGELITDALAQLKRWFDLD